MPWLTFLSNGEHVHKHTRIWFPQTKSPARVNICFNVDLKAEKKIFLQFCKRDSVLFNRLCILFEVQTWIFLTTWVWLYKLLSIIYVHLRLRTGGLSGDPVLVLWSSCVSETVLSQAGATKVRFSLIKVTSKI